MNATLLSQSPTTYVLVFETDDEVVSNLVAFATEHRLDAGHFTAIGAFRQATIAFFDWDQKDYKKIPITEQVEVLSMVGNIAQADNGTKVHAHVVLGKADGAAVGGHLMDARVRPTLEVVITESPKHLRRRIDEETGLALIRIDSNRVV